MLEWGEHYNLLYLCYVIIFIEFTIKREHKYHQTVLLQSQGGRTKYKGRDSYLLDRTVSA